MKTKTFKFFIILFLGVLSTLSLWAQNNQNITPDEPEQIYLVQKFDGTKFIGTIISQDEREVLMDTKDMGRFYIPKHLIKEIKPIFQDEKDHYLTEELFATRYFITTNGLPIKKGENYIQWNLYGPDFQFGVADNFGVGGMTS